MDFQLQHDSSVPIYRQLADSIYQQILSGSPAYGEKLPTVRDLAESTGLAKGTVKKAYEELAQLGVVEMTQGRGTFVCFRRNPTASRKEQAMAAIDEMLEKLEELSFSPAETSIYLDLKMREHAGKNQALQVALVECNTETISQIARQLYSLRGIDLHPLLLSEISEHPNRLEDGMDLIVTTITHVDEISNILASAEKLEQIVLAPTASTVISLARLPASSKLGIVCKSARFASMALKDCQTYSKVSISGTHFLGLGSLEDFLKTCDCVLIPADYSRICSPAETLLLEKAVKKNKAILYSCGLDGGSMLHLQTRLDKLRNQKNTVS